jgi:hypothetical protein
MKWAALTNVITRLGLFMVDSRIPQFSEIGYTGMS